MYIVATAGFTFQTTSLKKAMLHLNWFKAQGIKVKLFMHDDIIGRDDMLNS